MAQHDSPDPAELPDDDSDTNPPRPSGSVLFAPRPAESRTAATGPRDGFIAGRPQAASAAPAETSRASRAVAPTVIGLPSSSTAGSSQAAVESRADATTPRAHLARAAQATMQRAAAATATAAAAPAPQAWSRPNYWQGSTERAATATQAQPPAGRPGRPRATHRPATVWVVHAAQAVAVQVAIIAVLIGVHKQFAVMVLLLAGAFALLALSILRWNGRWAYQWLGISLRYACRRRSRTMPADAPVGEFLRPFLRGVQVDTVEIDDVDKALLTHAGGLTVVLETAPADGGIFVESAATVPPPTVLLALGEEVGPPVSAQLVVHTTPAPGGSGAQLPVAQSYHALAQGMIPARRRAWIAVQGLRTPDDIGSDDSALRESLLRAVMRLQRRLQREGMRGHVLDSAQLATDLGVLTGAETVRLGGGASVRLREQWSSWAAGAHPQVTYRLLAWPDLATEAGRQFFDRLVTLPTVATTIGIAARRAGRSGGTPDVELEASVRVTVPADRPNLLARQLYDLAGQHRVRVQRMNGEHVFGVTASLPLGGFIT